MLFCCLGSLCAVDENDLAPGLHFGLPAGITVVRATPKKGRQRVSRPLSPFALPRAAPAAKTWGRSHHQHPSRPARRCAGREGDPRGAASLRFPATDARNPCCPASDAPFRGSLQPQWRGLGPLREKRCGWHNHVTLRCHPPLLKGGHPYGGICVTPRGGNRRSFQAHRWTPIVPPLGALSQ